MFLGIDIICFSLSAITENAILSMTYENIYDAYMMMSMFFISEFLLFLVVEGVGKHKVKK